ncbi:hypothetical protein K2V74_05245 [Mammaliicoccus sciuri]|uniref:radical SAM protein n=1 Tax=Mammaliicoccus sciuri TaxID=1296 RepID=UPI001E3CEA87|nr:radical SAM protein [Mammaliicoccus sciuri]MCD8873735.1 hypothetical protein [Mammaliicoccus sciuri]
MENVVYPNTITILTTYQCTAACKECCFDCGPRVNGRLSLEQIKLFIKESKETIGDDLKAVVFTGGECFLLGEDLVEAISYAKSLGLSSRCVSNGYWAFNMKKAMEMMSRMKNAGLNEINISTGDDHQEYVSFDRVLNAAIAACKNDITALIVVEGHETSNFKYTDVITNDRFIEFKDNYTESANLKVMNNIWIPFNKDRDISYKEELVKSEKNVSEFKGCENILSNFGLNPYNQVVSCCGLTMEYIPELKLGEFKKGNLKDIFYNQFDNFMNIWLWVDGPEKILYFACQKDPSISFGSITHNCQACARVFKDKNVTKVIKENWKEVFEEVMFKYHIKLNEFNREKQFF